MWSVVWSAVKMGLRWIAPGLIGYVTGDIIANHEKSEEEDTIKAVAQSAAGTASTNWVKWLAFAVIGVAASVVAIIIFKLKSK